MGKKISLINKYEFRSFVFIVLQEFELKQLLNSLQIACWPHWRRTMFRLYRLVSGWKSYAQKWVMEWLGNVANVLDRILKLNPWMTLANWFEPDSFRQFCLAEIFKFKTLDRAALRVSQPLALCVQFCKVARHFRFGSLFVCACSSRLGNHRMSGPRHDLWSAFWPLAGMSYFKF